MEDEVYILRGLEEDREELRALAMCMATLGIPLRPTSFSDRTFLDANGNRVRQLCWYLAAKGSGRLAAKVFEQWNDRDWQAENPWDPVTVMRAYHDNMRGALAHEPLCEGIILRRGKTRLTVPKAYTRAQIDAAISRIEKKL